MKNVSDKEMNINQKVQTDYLQAGIGLQIICLVLNQNAYHTVLFRKTFCVLRINNRITLPITSSASLTDGRTNMVGFISLSLPCFKNLDFI